MKSIVFFISIFYFTTSIHAQSEPSLGLKEQIRNSRDHDLENKKLGIVNIENSENAFEIRLYFRSTRVSNVKVIQSKNGRLSARYIKGISYRVFYLKTLEQVEPKITRYAINPKNLDSIFFQLVASNVFTLPTMSSLITKGFVNEFCIQTKTDGKIREYSFQAPWNNNYEGEEFRNYKEIIKLFDLIQPDLAKVEN